MNDDLDFSKGLFPTSSHCFRPTPPKDDPLKKPVRRVRVFQTGENKPFCSNVDVVLQKIYDGECTKQKKLSDSPLKKELQESNRRLARIRRGVPLKKVLEDEYPVYKVENHEMRYKGAGKAIGSLSSSYKKTNIKKIKFIMPINKCESKKLTSNINEADESIKKFRKIASNGDEMSLLYHNEMVKFLNHANERRERSMKEFSKNIDKYGFEKARKIARRASQKSRLRVFNQGYEWWDDFLDFAFQKPVGQNEQHLIEVISRYDMITEPVFINLIHDVKKNVKKSKRCLELLSWINDREKIVDKNVEMLFDHRKMLIGDQLNYTRTMTTKKIYC